MSKNIELDKFYTPTETAQKCVDLMLSKVTNKMFVTEYLEPSAGSGNFSKIIKGCVAYDIEPQAENIIKDRISIQEMNRYDRHLGTLDDAQHTCLPIPVLY